ncbi:MAG: DegT/DnrJ/EryC1/StrS family aminotransferase [Chlorobiales bacterium]|nr:DegT/DnrJ/EryC1/StrS family aminotransferase [Chlorobiales bacterium]
MKVKFLDLKVQYDQLKPEVMAAWETILDNTAYVGGPAVGEFEEAFAAYCQSKYAIGLANGTEAIEVALRAMEIGPGDEVIVPANTFIATAEAVSATGAKIVLVDNEPGTYLIDTRKIEAAITPRTKVIIPVHLYGQPADLDTVRAIAEKHGVPVVEDAAQAHGAYYKGKRIGSGKSKAVSFSFYPGKNLGAYGDAGAVVTDDEALLTRMKMIGNHGGIKKYQHDVVGRNSRLDTLQAAVLKIKLKYLDSWNAKRLKNARLYTELLADVEEVKTPVELPETVPVYHLYVVRVPNREALQEKLAAKGISTGIHYPLPLHMMKAYEHLGYKASDFPVSAEYAPQVLSLPMYAELSEAEIEYVAKMIKENVLATA